MSDQPMYLPVVFCIMLLMCVTINVTMPSQGNDGTCVDMVTAGQKNKHGSNTRKNHESVLRICSTTRRKEM